LYAIARLTLPTTSQNVISNTVIAIRRIVSIEGGVTNEFLKNTIQLWAGMLLHSLGFFEGPAVEVEEE